MGPDGVSVDENVNLPKAKEVTDKYNITIGGNIPLTTTMLHGNQEDNMKGVIDLIDSLDHHNLIVSPGCDMPYDTPIENTIACAQAVKSPDSTRELIKNYETFIDDSNVEIPDYKNRDKVLIECFLLDPEQCAACTYTVSYTHLITGLFQERGAGCRDRTAAKNITKFSKKVYIPNLGKTCTM